MTKKQQETVLCQICKEQKKLTEVIPAQLIREPIAETIRKTYPDWSTSGFICISDLNHFRTEYVQDVLETEKGELSTLEEQVVKSLEEHELLSENINIEFEQQLTFGERLADKIAEFGGSWRFIIIFFVMLSLWIAINSLTLILKPFDPYPFILLNLILSCLASIQAPIIMMSQNRQEAKDRLRAEHDYRINLKAELEIRHLHEKIDHLLMHQWQRLLEIQEIQMELMEELSRKTPQGRGT
ncbi:DUF1003 domain-containing protein [Candidatus Poribacteria bacterium]|nr:DUF1003 domain-containing protein [Candidatus Poribacteria bacterium]